MTHTDGTGPWDVASLRRVADAAVADVGARVEAVRQAAEQQLAVLNAGPTPVEGLVTAALLRQDAVTITPEAAAEVARVLFHEGLLPTPVGPASVQDRVRLEAIRALHKPVGMYDECDCDDPDDDAVHVEADEIGLTCNLTHRVCRVCCIQSDDIQSEDCADRHDHTEGQSICATVAILDADLDGESVEDFGPLSKGATAMIPASYPVADFADASEDRAAIERVRDMHQSDGSEPPSCAYCWAVDPTWPCHTIAALDGAP